MQGAYVKVQLASEIAETVFKQYFTVEKTNEGNIFIYGGKTYSYVMFGNQNLLEAKPPQENWLVINRHERWINPGDNKVIKYEELLLF